MLLTNSLRLSFLGFLLFKLVTFHFTWTKNIQILSMKLNFINMKGRLKSKREKWKLLPFFDDWIASMVLKLLFYSIQFYLPLIVSFNQLD